MRDCQDAARKYLLQAKNADDSKTPAGAIPAGVFWIPPARAAGGKANCAGFF